MSTLLSALTDVSRAIGLALADTDPTDVVLVACSGGADSLGLAAGAAKLARRDGRRVGAIVIDHQLQPNAAAVAAQAAAQCVRLGLDPVEVIAVDVTRGPGSGGLESAARDARRGALQEAANRHAANAVLLGHTRDDQAETVLLGLARGSGARSLGGMSDRDGLWRRPLLRLDRAALRAACDEAGLVPIDDPHNFDVAFARVRVRSTVLPVLEEQLGPGVGVALARTADLLRADADALDEWAHREYRCRAVISDGAVVLPLAGASNPGAGTASTGTAALAQLPVAVRTRVVRLAMQAAGCPAGGITYRHVQAGDALLRDWHGQGATRLPGDVEVSRRSGRLWFKSVGPLHL